MGRFLNADDTKFLGENDKVLGYNLLAYCVNDSVNKTDVNGNIVAQIVMALIGALIGASSYLIGYLI